MFKDCKTGGYNLESTYAEGQRLSALILLIAIAYTWMILAGRNSRNRGVQKYLVRIQQLQRIHRRHSTFWVGLYGYLWVAVIEFCSQLAFAFMRSIPHKLLYLQRGLRSMALIQSAF